jgi:glycosyltransferase involved in cell wall biosynthesis
MVEHGQTGLLAAIGDDAALLAALYRLLDDSPMRQRLGAAGRRRFLRSYVARLSGVRLEEIFREAVARAAAPTPVAVAGG